MLFFKKYHFLLRLLAFSTCSLLVLSERASGLDEHKKVSSPSSHTQKAPSSNPQRLSSPEQHTKYLLDTIHKAQKSLTISSYSVNEGKLSSEGILNALKAAKERGVKIYIYYKKGKLTKKTFSLMKETCRRFEKNANHSKCAILDNKEIAIGSYNWLAADRKGSLNSSLAVAAPYAQGLIKSFWEGMRFYQRLKHKGKRDSGSSSVNTLPLSRISNDKLSIPEGHLAFLETQIFRGAKKEVFISSPFIRFQRLQETLTDFRMQSLEQRKVKTTLYTLPTPCNFFPEEEKVIFEYLDALKKKYPSFTYQTRPGLHAKTLVADNLISEGSFNILSGVRNIDHSANNYEVSFALKGKVALPFIKEFRQAMCVAPTGKNLKPPHQKKPLQAKENLRLNGK